MKFVNSVKFGHTFAPTRSKKSGDKFSASTLSWTIVTFVYLSSVTPCDASITLSYHQNTFESYNNATLSFFFTGDPQFGWGTYYSGNVERSLRYKSLN